MKWAHVPNLLGEDWEDAFDSLISAPGAFGNLIVGAARQVRPVDGVALSLVIAGLGWAIGGYAIAGHHDSLALFVSLLPLALWITAGVVGGLIFEIGGIGLHSLAYWESYLLILLFAACGTVSLRIALNPRDRRVYRSTTPATKP